MFDSPYSRGVVFLFPLYTPVQIKTMNFGRQGEES